MVWRWQLYICQTERRYAYYLEPGRLLNMGVLRWQLLTNQEEIIVLAMCRRNPFHLVTFLFLCLFIRPEDSFGSIIEKTLDEDWFWNYVWGWVVRVAFWESNDFLNSKRNEKKCIFRTGSGTKKETCSRSKSSMCRGSTLGSQARVIAATLGVVNILCLIS